MPTILLQPPSVALQSNPTSSPSPLPPLLQTPLGLAIIEIQGTLNLPASVTTPVPQSSTGVKRRRSRKQADADNGDEHGGEAKIDSRKKGSSSARMNAGDQEMRDAGDISQHMYATSEQRRRHDGTSADLSAFVDGSDMAGIGKDVVSSHMQTDGAGDTMMEGHQQNASGKSRFTKRRHHSSAEDTSSPTDEPESPSKHEAPVIQATQIGRLVFPLLDLDSTSNTTIEPGPWMKKVHLYIGKNQRLVGEVRKLQKPLAVLKKIPKIESPAKKAGSSTTEDEMGEQVQIVEILRWKLFFGGRPEFV